VLNFSSLSFVLLDLVSLGGFLKEYDIINAGNDIAFSSLTGRAGGLRQ
jgi:hypothetical protein